MLRENVKRASNDRALAPETERKTDTERETGRVTINTVSTSRKATNEIAAAVQRGQRTRSTADIAKRKNTDSLYYSMTTLPVSL